MVLFEIGPSPGKRAFAIFTSNKFWFMYVGVFFKEKNCGLCKKPVIINSK